MKWWVELSLIFKFAFPLSLSLPKIVIVELVNLTHMLDDPTVL